MLLRSRKDWAGFEPAKIPTKAHMPQIERWLDTLPAGSRILDVGCGTGGAARLALGRGHSVVGLDINEPAIVALGREFAGERRAEFRVRDVGAPSGFELEGAPFDAAICQLVASVVGDAADRVRLLSNMREALAPKGKLFISFSGLSDDLNPSYAELYARDFSETAEHGTYLSRDAGGRVLYRTHHFSAEEIHELLVDQRFREIRCDESVEVSSRRADQRAFLLRNVRARLSLDFAPPSPPKPISRISLPSSCAVLALAVLVLRAAEHEPGRKSASVLAMACAVGAKSRLNEKVRLGMRGEASSGLVSPNSTQV